MQSVLDRRSQSTHAGLRGPYTVGQILDGSALFGAVCRRRNSLGLLIAAERLHPERQPRELFADNLQLVLRVGFVEPVDYPDQRADILLGQL